MTSSEFELPFRRKTYVRLIGDIEHQLNLAFDEEHTKRNLTQQEMADLLNVDKSFISRKMSGTSNMTLETLADLAFALDRAIEIKLRSRTAPDGSNRLPAVPTTDAKPKSAGPCDANVPFDKESSNPIFVAA
jgi:hypothetical protein